MDAPERNKRLVEEHYAAIWSGDEPRLRQQVAGDFRDHGKPAGTPPGVEPVLAHSRAMRTAFPDMKVTLQRTVAEGDLVAVQPPGAARTGAPSRPLRRPTNRSRSTAWCSGESTRTGSSSAGLSSMKPR